MRKLWIAAWAAVLLLNGCATVPEAPRLLSLDEQGQVAGQAAPCEPQHAMPALGTTAALQPSALRILSWNLHKGQDAGWREDLQRWAASHDLLLLQEVVLTPELRAVLEGAGHRWQMAGAFAMGGLERGVLIAARVAPLSVCTLRTFEPLFPLPKSALIAHFRLPGEQRTLAVANLHGINFTLGLKAFRAQIDAVARELARHDGPIVLGGDFNTWSDERGEVLLAVAERLRLAPVVLAEDKRRRAFGRVLDHLFTRGFAVHAASAPEVRSSDHNPLLVELAAQ